MAIPAHIAPGVVIGEDFRVNAAMPGQQGSPAVSVAA